jgi:hypothetical protein
MNSVLIAIACVGMVIVTEVAVAVGWLLRELRMWRNVLVPWMNNLHNEIKGKK